MHDVITLAGPAATIIAAVVAVLVTYRLGRGQQRIAEQQAATALDQLRYNLFKRRYAIYKAACTAIDIAFAKRNDTKMPEELNILFLKFEESRWLFTDHPNIYVFLAQLHKDIHQFLQENYNHRYRIEQTKSSQSGEVRKVILEEEARLLTFEEALHVQRTALPKTFGDALAFPQLTARSRAHSKTNRPIDQ